MDRSLLLEAVRQLEHSGVGKGEFWALAQSVRQFNQLLKEAKVQFPVRHDIQALSEFSQPAVSDIDEVRDAIKRLRVALELRSTAAAFAFLNDDVILNTAGSEVLRDIVELQEVATLGLAKVTLLLSGVIAEGLLLSRHPDSSDRGPGLASLIAQAKAQKLFGRDTLRQLDTLVDYRDLIHPRAQTRNRMQPNDARIESALNALRLLFAELREEPGLRFS